MNEDPVTLATDAVQAQERVHLYIKSNRKQFSYEAYSDSEKGLEHLKSMKSEIEGSNIKFEKVSIQRDILQDKVRPLMLMNVPGSLSLEDKKKLKLYIEEAFKGSVERIIFAGIVTCPWYWSTNGDRGIQAKHNRIFVVYQYKESQVFSPINPHLNEQNQVIEEDWFYASELEHFVHYLYKGSSRFIECLYLPDESLIFSSDEWLALKSSPGLSQILSLRGFLEQCRGQAVGSVAKKSKSGSMYLRDGATLYNFCESFRLLHHAHLVLLSGVISMNRLSTEHLQLQSAQEAHRNLLLAYNVSSKRVHKDDLFTKLMEWRTEIDSLMKNHSFTKANVIEDILSTWLYSVRCWNKVPHPLEITADEKLTVEPLIQKIGGNFSKMAAEQVLMVAQAGSYLYDLATPESDEDFVIIYADSIKKVLGSCVKPVESFEKRGPDLAFEYGAYEARLFAEMLWKGSVVILELVFAEGLAYTSHLWKILADNKHMFLTERAILQYFGLIKNNMVMIENRKHEHTPREKKLFYQIFHKLHSLEYFLEGKVPPVRCSGEVKGFIMKIRKGPLEGEISREQLYTLANKKIFALRNSFAHRKYRLPENVNYDFLRNWLKSVRGWSE